MQIVLSLLLVSGASALETDSDGPEQYPFSKSFNFQAPKNGDDGPIDFTLRHPVCASEDSFYGKDEPKPSAMLEGPKIVDNKAPSKLPPARNLKVSVQSNSMSQFEIRKHMEEAQRHLNVVEGRMQDMTSQFWQNPALARDFSFNSMRRKLLIDQGMAQKKVMLLRNQLFAEQQRTAGHVKDFEGEELEKEAKFDVWYINMDKNEDRRQCLERQLTEAGVKNFNRFRAVEILGLTKEDRKLLFRAKTAKEAENAYISEIKRLGYGDCIEGGFDFEATSTHGSQKSKEWHIRNAVLANYCGHKRLLKAQEKNDTAADYIVILEDDVILDRKWFKPVIQDFIANFDKTKKWTMVQLDPFGSKSTEDYVSSFHGKPVWKPQFKAPCSQYWGFQAVIFRKSALPEINEYMQKNPAMPIDWLQYKISNTLGFSSGTAHNPESLANADWQVAGQTVEAPKFCRKSVMKSTIAFTQLTEADKSTVPEPASEAKFKKSENIIRHRSQTV